MENTPTLAPDSAQHNAQGILHDHAGDNQEFTCEICIEPMKIPDKRFKNSDKCEHPFCTDCVIKYIPLKVEDDNAGRIKCPALNCDHTLDPLACAPLIGPSLFLRWCDVLCKAAILGVDKCYCPYGNCNVVILNECGGDLRKSSCPNCKRLFCFRCRRVWHEGFRCEDTGEERDLASGRRVVPTTNCRCEIICGQQGGHRPAPPCYITFLVFCLLTVALFSVAMMLWPKGNTNV